MLIDINSGINSSSINRSQRRRQCTTTPNCLHKLTKQQVQHCRQRQITCTSSYRITI